MVQGSWDQMYHKGKGIVRILCRMKCCEVKIKLFYHRNKLIIWLRLDIAYSLSIATFWTFWQVKKKQQPQMHHVGVHESKTPPPLFFKNIVVFKIMGND